MLNLKNAASNLLTLLIGCILAFIILELGLRIFDPFKFSVRGNEITLPSNIKYVTTNEFASKLDREIIHSKNSLGFRGEDPPANMKEVLSIIAIGGSTTESRFQSDNNEWGYLLGQNLSKHFDPIWINNAGLDGHSTFGHQILVRDLIAPLRPDVVIFLVGINEVGRKDLIIDEKKLKDEVQLDSPTMFLLSLANNSEALSLAVNMIRYYKAKGAGLTHNTQHNLYEDMKRKFDIPDVQREGIISEHILKYIPQYEKRLEKLLQTTLSIGSKPVLMTQPVLYGPVIDDITGLNMGELPVTGDMDGSLAWDVLEKYNDALRKAAKKHNLLLIDLANKVPKSSSLYYDNIHFTNKGAELVAENIYQSLCPWLAEQYSMYVIKECPAP